MGKRLGWVVLVGLAVLGCKPVKTLTERNDSFAPYEGLRVGGVPVREFVGKRFARVFGGATGISITPDPRNPGGSNFAVLGKRVRVGSAMAIDKRGYLLTAAHVLDIAPADGIQVLFSDGKTVRATRAEFVWRGDYLKGEADLGIIWIPEPLVDVFEWADAILPGEAVIGAGPTGPLASKNKLEINVTLFAGKIAGRARMEGVLPGERIEHTAPARQGDSGGPVINLVGQLVGVTSAGSSQGAKLGPVVAYTGAVKFFATRPRVPAQLKEIIDRDYAKRGVEAPKP